MKIIKTARYEQGKEIVFSANIPAEYDPAESEVIVTAIHTPAEKATFDYPGTSDIIEVISVKKNEEEIYHKIPDKVFNFLEQKAKEKIIAKNPKI
ncbi:MAG: hypothetical protein WDA06_15965 [Phenylobacterium sp.]